MVKCGSYDSKTFDGYLGFQLRDRNTKEQLGCARLARYWHWKGKPSVVEDCLIIPKSPWDDTSLDFSRMGDALGRDKTTGDYPIQRLLAQLAVEIFNREEDKKLQIDSHRYNKTVYAAGGFGFHQGLRNEAIEQLEIARQTGFRFGPMGHDGSATFDLSKDPGSVAGTKFVRLDYEDKKIVKTAALVDFELGASPITWEEQIAKKPLLDDATGPVMPRFLKNNLWKLKGPS